ncbi:MAG: hypothetical protein WBB28_27055 [Crinalium sp.]
MNNFTLKLNTDAIYQAVERSLDATAETANTAFKDAIEQPLYEWPRTTVRKSGEVVSTPRNIVDTGDLRDSQEHQKVDELNHQFSWNVPYAVQVHEGAVLKSGTELPARPWTREAVTRTDLVEVFIEAFNANQS